MENLEQKTNYRAQNINDAHTKLIDRMGLFDDHFLAVSGLMTDQLATAKYIIATREFLRQIEPFLIYLINDDDDAPQDLDPADTQQMALNLWHMLNFVNYQQKQDKPETIEDLTF